jgi:hypothetical protein
MAAQISSRRADTGLPDILNHWAFDDNTYWDDGTTFEQFKGSVLAHLNLLEGRGSTKEGEFKMGRSRSHTNRSGVIRFGAKPSFSVRTNNRGF